MEKQQQDRGQWSTKVSRACDAFVAWRGWASKPIRLALLVLACAMFAVAVVTPLELAEQAVFAISSLVVAFTLRRVAGRLPTLILVLLSTVVSLRYMYWRLTSTVDFTHPLDLVFGWGLVLAELYVLSVLLLGYVQTIWPLQRKPVPLPADPATWPSVDVLIPTYNEPLDIVRQVVLTALSLDWPADKLTIYMLDDGRRPEFQAFCEEVGIHYLTRADNRHAKAGNLNAALSVTRGEFVAVFDCDHVPTRSFLQVSMGWFLRDPKLAMLQTPHVFFSPDPFEKNLETFRAVPNEGDLFYGLVQDGNDLWNAAFFCGSCAVLRRSALEQVGGVATETVTEDAHTSLKLSRAGFNSAYLPLPQAAGLATENLARHIGQRVRWARGMAQIFRVDNPLLGRGLNLFQRLCFLNAMLHFFYGLPRLVFLTAPLAYLFFGAQVFQATALMIAAYALPHIMHASLANSRMQGAFRHSFWNEVYETVLAWYIMRPVLAAIVNPRSGAFNVTSKGGATGEAYFDWQMARPYLVLLALNMLGLAVGIGRLIFGSHDSDVILTLCINLAWTLYNIMIASASVAVASEARQVRAQHRVMAELPARVRLADGQEIDCHTSDFSPGGLGLRLPDGMPLPPSGVRLWVSLSRGDLTRAFPARVVFSAGGRLGLRFDELSMQQQVDLAAMTFARADTWARVWGKGEPDTPWLAFKTVSRIGLRGMRQLLQLLRGQASERLHANTELLLSKAKRGHDNARL